MKRVKLVLIVAVAALALLSCYWVPTSDTGDLKVVMSGEPRGTGDYYARVWLLTEDNVLVPIGDSEDYAEVKISTGEDKVTVEGIPAGPRYKALVSVGWQRATENGSWFQVDRYAQSALFEISAGSTIDVPVTMAACPFNTSTQLMGVDLKGMVTQTVASPVIYTVSAGTLYSGSNVDAMTSSAALPGGHTANSVSLGANVAGAGSGYTIWVNTNRAILPSNGSAFNTTFSSGMGVRSILESGVHSGNYLFYQRDSGLGGANASTTPATEWTDVDLEGIVSGRPVRDFVIVNPSSPPYSAYFATKIGAFSITDTTDLDDIFTGGTFFTVGGSSNPILAIEYVSTPMFTFGTGNGIWRGGTPAGASQVTGTAGYSFYMVAVSGTNWAALSPYYLFIGNGSTVTRILPFNAGLPGSVSALAWLSGDVVIAGSEGLVSITP